MARAKVVQKNRDRRRGMLVDASSGRVSSDPVIS
jgi:hypothetical protein